MTVQNAISATLFYPASQGVCGIVIPIEKALALQPHDSKTQQADFLKENLPAVR